MNINLLKTMKAIENKLMSTSHPSLEDLHKVYNLVLKLRSQLLSLISEEERFGTQVQPTEVFAYKLSEGALNQTTVTLTINEPLPFIKEMTAALQEHWLNLIHAAIEKAAQSGILPQFEKAFVWIEVITSAGTNNTRLWDTSNRAINLIINNLKGIFFEDDNLEHMAFGVHGSWGETGITIIKVLPFKTDESGFCL